LKINQNSALEPKNQLKIGDTIEVSVLKPVAAHLQGEATDRDMFYENDDLIVITKPAGLVVHPDNRNKTGTMVNAVINHCGFSLSETGLFKRLFGL